jgi:hypothetical protein
MKYKILKFLHRDSDITYTTEFHYIFITIGETINIFSSHIWDATLSKLKGTSV